MAKNNHFNNIILVLSLLSISFFALSAKADEDKVVGVYQLLSPVTDMGRDSKLVFERNGIVTIIWSSVNVVAQRPSPPRESYAQRGIWNKNEELYQLEFSDHVPILQPYYFKLIDNELMQCDEKGNFLPDGSRWSRKIK